MLWSQAIGLYIKMEDMNLSISFLLTFFIIVKGKAPTFFLPHLKVRYGSLCIICR